MALRIVQQGAGGPTWIPDDRLRQACGPFGRSLPLSSATVSTTSRPPCQEPLTRTCGRLSSVQALVDELLEVREPERTSITINEEANLDERQRREETFRDNCRQLESRRDKPTVRPDQACVRQYRL
jgi:hypothetical protein